MKLENRISAFSQLGDWLKNLSEEDLIGIHGRAVNENNWFTLDSIKSSFKAWGNTLTKSSLENWVQNSNLERSVPMNIGVIMAGNLPLVGLHDLITVLISGNKACIKYSSQDSYSMKLIIDKLLEIEAGFNEFIEERNQMKDIDAIIATGSDNSAKYFNQYFSSIPHVIRQNRVSVAVLEGSENEEELALLGNDIFQYFGLGCRNVAKIYIPESYDLTKFIAAQNGFEKAIGHHKYRNNYDYNKSIYLVNKEPHLDSGFFLMRDSGDLVSPISVVYYETYQQESDLSFKIAQHQDKIQCIVSKDAWYEGSLPLGEAQCPALWDYADGVDTLQWLSELN